MAMQLKTLPYTEEPLPPREVLPTMYDLPDEEVGQSGMPDIFHVWQARLLSETFIPPTYESTEIFTASDLNIYYDVRNVTQYKRPDWFAVTGLPKGSPSEMRLSYVVWQEGIDPLIVVELLSPSTEKDDLGKRLRDVTKPPTKWDVYEQILRIPYYVVFSRYTNELRIFKLFGARYEEVKDHEGRFWVEALELGIGVWKGRYLNEDRLWLRWYDRDGNWIPTLDERAVLQTRRAEQAAQRAEQESQRAEVELQAKKIAEQRAQQLEAKLRELGIDPDQV